MRQIRLGVAMRRDWMSEDDAVRGVSLANRGEKTPYQLETRQVSLSITGSMPNLHHFLARLDKIDKFIHTKSVSLQRSDTGENSAALKMDILLFDLVQKPAE